MERIRAQRGRGMRGCGEFHVRARIRFSALMRPEGSVPDSDKTGLTSHNLLSDRSALEGNLTGALKFASEFEVDTAIRFGRNEFEVGRGAHLSSRRSLLRIHWRIGSLTSKLRALCSQYHARHSLASGCSAVVKSEEDRGSTRSTVNEQGPHSFFSGGFKGVLSLLSAPVSAVRFSASTSAR